MEYYIRKRTSFKAWRVETNNDDGTHLDGLVAEINEACPSANACHDGTTLFVDVQGLDDDIRTVVHVEVGCVVYMFTANVLDVMTGEDFDAIYEPA